MFNPAISKLTAPPVSVVQDWRASYDGRLGELIDMSQAVPGYAAHPEMTAALEKAAANPDSARYGRVEGDLELRDAYAFGGGLHCCTADVYREGDLKDYFPKQ